MTSHQGERVGSGPAGPGMAQAPSGELPPHDPVEPRQEPVAAPERRSVDDLAGHIVELAGEPIDLWAIAALLESIGIRDLDAVERYGRRDVFALAQAVQIRLPEPGAGPADPEDDPFRTRLRRFARYYGRGTFFFLPLGLQLIALLAVGISQYAALTFTLRDASILAAAAALSFLVTSGFTQGLGYLGPQYSETGKHMLAEKASWAIVGLGIASTLLVGVVTWIVVAATGSYPAEDMRVAAVYYALLAAQGMASALLYMLHRYLAMLASTVLALVLAGVLYKRTGLEVEVIHWIALTVGVAAEFAVAWRVLRRKAADTRGDLRVARFPRRTLLRRRVLPFALYGFLYFAFLTVDRAVAWAAGDNPLPLWFHPSYELGLDWALAGVVFALAFLEVAVEGFSKNLVPTSEGFVITAKEHHNTAVARFWARQLAFIGLLAATGTWLALGLAVLLNDLDALGPAQVVYDDPITRYVFGMGVLGYTFLALGIANSVFVMSLNQPRRALVSVSAGIVVALAVSIAATSSFPYWTSVFGLVAGTAAFALLSGWQAWRTFRRADYFSFAAW